jgi:type IV pilus assembly protein PilE
MTMVRKRRSDAGHRRGLMRQRGFTLLELMVVVTIVAILAGIAYASYSQHVIKSRRAAAATCLQQGAQLMERHYTTSLTYVGANEPVACDGLGDFYDVGFDGDPTAKTFTLKAEPTSRQPDTKCGVLTLDQKGERGAEGDDCW